MIYLNQLDYPDLYYPTNTSKGGLGPGKDNVKTAGCGLCCCCMVVENMTLEHFPLVDCLHMAMDLEANLKPGTDLKILGKAVAEKFGLVFSTTDSPEELLAHLKNGGMAIANSGGDREGYTGLFTHGGHYITVISADGDTVCVLDPSQTPDKYDTPERKGKVKVDGHFVYCSIRTLMEDCSNRQPAYYLFKRSNTK